MSGKKTGCGITVLGAVILLIELWELLILGYMLDPKGASQKADVWGAVLTLAGVISLVAGLVWRRRKK